MITDYLGNEVKEGDEIVFITVIDRHSYVHGALIPAAISESGKPEQIWEEKRPDKPCWKLGKYNKVVNPNGNLSVIQDAGEYTFYLAIDFMLTTTNNTEILAIKGKSDTQDQYNEFLKNQLKLEDNAE
jgi:hypothetical protein